MSADSAWQEWLDTPPDERKQSFWSTEDVFKAGYSVGAAEALRGVRDQFTDDYNAQVLLMHPPVIWLLKRLSIVANEYEEAEHGTD